MPRPVAGTAGLIADELASGHRAVGRHAVPEPLQAPGRSHHAPARLQCLDGRALVGEAATRNKSADMPDLIAYMHSARVRASPPSRASKPDATATGTVSCASRSWSRRRSCWSPSRRSRASCIRSPSSTRSASTSRKPNAKRSRNEPPAAGADRCRHLNSSRRKSMMSMRSLPLAALLCRGCAARRCRRLRPLPTRCSSPTRRTTRSRSSTARSSRSSRPSRSASARAASSCRTTASG